MERAHHPRRGSVRYLPGLGIWPLAIALIAALPVAYLACRTLPPATVSCNTMDARPSDAKLCSTTDGNALGRVSMLACRDTPQALEPLLAPGNPLVVPHVTATEFDFGPPPRLPFDSMAGCERKDKTEPKTNGPSSTVIIGSNVVIDGRPASTPAPAPFMPRALASKELDPSDRITADAARTLIAQCALSPDTSGSQRAVTVIVVRHDYSRGVLVVLSAMALALLVMLRRRVRVTLEDGVVSIVERGFFVVKRRASLPAADIERAVVATGARGPLNGKRVELALRNGSTLPLIDSFVLSISDVHARTARALDDLLAPRSVSQASAPLEAPRPRRSRLALAFIVMACAIGAPLAGTMLLRHRAATGPSALVGELARLGAARDGSTILTATLGSRKLAIVADDEANDIRAVDLPAASAPLGRTPDVLSAHLTSAPGAMVMDANGRIFVTLPRESRIAVMELSNGVLLETRRIATEAEPVAISLTKDDTRLVAISNWGQALEVWKTSTFDRERSVSLPRSPRTLTLSADDATAAVGHEVGGIMSLVDLRSGTRTERSLRTLVDLPTKSQQTRKVIDARGHARTETFEVRDQQWSPIQQERIARVGGAFYVAGARATTGNPNDTRVQYYGSGNVDEHFDLGVIHAGEERGTSLGKSILTQVNPAYRGCLLPRAVVPDEANEWLYVACEGPGRVYKIDLGGKRCHVDGAWGAPFAVAEAPTGLAVVEDDRTLLVWSPAAQKLTVLPFDGGIEAGSHWAFGSDIARNPWRQWIHELSHGPRDVRAELVAHGRELFHATNDARVSASGVACANCHIDGRDDGLTWPTPQGPRQTPVLAGHLTDTAPYGWTGEHPTLPVYLEQTFKRLGGSGLHGDDLDAIVAYVESMPAPRFRAKNADAVARGRALFMSPQTQCSGCHSGQTFTDRERHDVTSKAPSDKQQTFDTPSLLYVGGSAPYFHDGRYATLLDLVSRNHDAMGQTSQLTEDQRTDLVSYLSSLGETPEDGLGRGRQTARGGTALR